MGRFFFAFGKASLFVLTVCVFFGCTPRVQKQPGLGDPSGMGGYIYYPLPGNANLPGTVYKNCNGDIHFRTNLAVKDDYQSYGEKTLQIPSRVQSATLDVGGFLGFLGVVGVGGEVDGKLKIDFAATSGTLYRLHADKVHSKFLPEQARWEKLEPPGPGCSYHIVYESVATKDLVMHITRTDTKGFSAGTGNFLLADRDSLESVISNIPESVKIGAKVRLKYHSRDSIAIEIRDAKEPIHFMYRPYKIESTKRTAIQFPISTGFVNVENEYWNPKLGIGAGLLMPRFGVGKLKWTARLAFQPSLYSNGWLFPLYFDSFFPHKSDFAQVFVRVGYAWGKINKIDNVGVFDHGPGFGAGMAYYPRLQSFSFLHSIEALYYVQQSDYVARNGDKTEFYFDQVLLSAVFQVNL